MDSSAMKTRVSSSHQRYLDLGCTMTRKEIGAFWAPRTDVRCEIHYYGPCAICGEEMRDTNEHGYEDVSRSPYTMDAYGPPDITVCTSCAHRRYRESIDLTGRMARCHCGRTVPSSWSLAFFEYQGPESRDAHTLCGSCRYAKAAHGEINPRTKRPCITDHPFTPRGGIPQDRYYCGCQGWD